MEKIKSLLHPHGHDKDRETAGHVTHDNKGTAGTAAQSSTAAPASTAATSGTTSATTSAATGHQSTPIFDEMTGHGNTPKFSNTPNVGAGAGTGTTAATGFAGDKHAGHVGTDGPIGGARVAETSDNTSHISDSARHGESSRPQVNSGTYDGNSEASIKSGVIGFAPGQSAQQHAALPSNSNVEDRLDRNQIVGQGNAGTTTSSGLRNEVTNEQPSVLPASSSSHHNSPPHQPYDSSSTGTDRSFPLSGGVSSAPNSTSTSHRLNTSEREPGSGERGLGGDDRHGRAGLAGAAAAAAGTAAAPHSRSNEPSAPQPGTVSDRNTSPTGHTHLTTSVREHNVHPDALHAAGIRPVHDSDDPSHGPPYETPHLNTGTLLDYEKAYGSDPHTHHTGLLDYRPHTHRSDTNPHIPGEFPTATPDNERSGPILAGASSTSGTSPSHDLRHTGSLNEPTPRSADQSDHHLGRDAAIAGGIGAAGLGAATHYNTSSSTGNLYDEKNPYSSKTLDPRVTGGESCLNEQRFDPAATSSSQPLSGSPAPVAPTESEERQHNYGRDAVIAGGALGAGALAGSALSGDRHRDANLADSPSLATSQHTTGTANPSTVGTTSTSHQLPSGSTATSSSHQPTSTHEPRHHYGRDAGLAGAGAATAGGLAYAASRDEPSNQRTLGPTAEDPASKTIGPHKSNIANILDPRVQPDPAKQKDHPTTGPHQSDTLNRADPRVDDKAGQHHYGRDAALAGGAGAAGYGAYEVAQAYGDHRSTQPGASMQEQRYDPAAAGARAPNPVPASSEYNYHNPDVAALAAATTAPGHDSAATGQTLQPYTTAQLAQSASSQPPQAYKAPEIDNSDLGPRDNSSRNAALGAGAGLAGAAAVGYGLSQHGDKDQHAPTPGTSTQPGSSSLAQPTGGFSGQQYPQTTDPNQSHTGRDAAIAGGAGAAAGAGAGYAYGQRAQPQFDPKEQERLEKETAKRQHDLEKKHDKNVHKLEKEQEKDLKKREEAAKHEEEKEKKGGILGFLHRDKSKKEKKDRSPESSPRHSAERRSGDYSSDDKFGHGSGYKGRNLLHKEPPEGHPAREALHANDRVGTDGHIGADRTDEHHYGRNAALGGGAIGAGALGAHELSKDRAEPSTLSSSTGTHDPNLTGHQTTLPDRTRNDPSSHGRDAALSGGDVGAGGLAAHSLHSKQTDPSSTTGHPGTGLAGTQQQQPVQDAFVSGKREHIGIDGPIGDPNMISGDRQTRHNVYGAHPVSDLAQDRTVIEPRTGLPMNVGRYGDGAGGTDGGPVAHRAPITVEGRVQNGGAGERAETDWEGVKGKDTVY